MPEIAGKEQKQIGKLRTIFFFCLLSCCFDRIVLVSKEMQQDLVGFYVFTEKNISVIYNGIVLPRIIFPKQSEKLNVGSARRLFPVKDFSLMVEIANLVISQSDAVNFVLAGDGPERVILEEKGRKLDRPAGSI